MSKRQVPAGKRGLTATKPLCLATPPWVKGPTGSVPPRLLCLRSEGHSAKKHQDGRGHQWDVIGR